MVKKAGIIILFTALFTCLFCLTGFAAELPEQIDIEKPDEVLPLSLNIAKYGYQTVYVPVTQIHEQADGSTITSTIYPGVVQITYKYFVTKSEVTDTYTGGYVVLSETYPNLTPIGDVYLDVSAARGDYPTRATVDVLPDQYTVSIRGGTFTITYNATVRYNAQGQIISTTPTTVTRSYSFTATGP